MKTNGISSYEEKVLKTGEYLRTRQPIEHKSVEKHNEVELEPSITARQMQETIEKLDVKKEDVDTSLGVTKTMTVNKVADIIEGMLLSRIGEILNAAESYKAAITRGINAQNVYEDIAKERANAIAEFLQGVTIK